MKPDGRRPGWDGHLLLLYNKESQRRTEVAEWVRHGLELGAKILYIEPEHEPPARSLSGLLQTQPQAVAAMASDQIQVVSADHAAYDPAWQASVVEQALHQGYPCVRWSADATTAWGVMSPARHAEIERAADQVCKSGPVSVMCQYPARTSMRVLRLVSAAHGGGLRERLLQATPIGGGLALDGQLDVSNQGILRAVLLAATTTARRDPFVLDLSGLDFLDLSGVRTLIAGTAPYRRLGGRVRLQAPQPHVDRLIRILGVDREQGLLTEALA
jgi:anti-anti-sigma factor